MADRDNRTGPKPVFKNDIVTPVGRLSFPHLDKPDEGKKFSDGKYKVTLLMPKQGTDFSTLRAAALATAQEAFGAQVKTLNDFQHPFRDGDQKAEGKELDGYKGCLYITCKSKQRPMVVDRAKNPIDPKDCYGGCKARLVVTACSYQSTENVRQPDGKVVKQIVRGVTFLLDVVQKVGDDKPLGGGRAASVSALPDDDLGPDAVAEAGAGPEAVGALAADAEAMFR